MHMTDMKMKTDPVSLQHINACQDLMTTARVQTLRSCLKGGRLELILGFDLNLDEFEMKLNPDCSCLRRVPQSRWTVITHQAKVSE